MTHCTQCGQPVTPNGNSICNDCRDQAFYLPERPQGWGLVRWIGIAILAAISVVIALIVL